MIDRLHYISQAPANGTHLQAIQQVLESGGKWIQLRVKDQPVQEILELAIAAKALCDAYSARLIVNDYPEIAKEANVHGIHLGLDDMPVRNARKLLGPQMVIGGTANTFEHILQRVEEGADYIGLGPYRFTSTKKKLSPIIGLQGYKDIISQVVAHNLSIPIVAIGGITLNDISLLKSIGLYGVAVSGALTKHPGQLQEMYDRLDVKTDCIC
jgi:thiamine-phosphate pyrophosphorylase